MKLQRRVRLGDVWLDDLDDRIVITAIEPEDGRENITAAETAAGSGWRITKKKRNNLGLVVKFRMLEHGRNADGMTERSQLLEKINAWAAPGGILRVNYKPGRRLNVDAVQCPGEGSLWDYSKEFQITFRAYKIPYWEDSTATSEAIGGNVNKKSQSITVEGSAETQLNVELANKSGAKIDKIKEVYVGGNRMSFSSGIALMGNETLVIDHKDGLVRCRIRDAGGSYRNIMKYRTGANDFTAEPGTITCGYEADRACLMTVSWRSRYV